MAATVAIGAVGESAKDSEFVPTCGTMISRKDFLSARHAINMASSVFRNSCFTEDHNAT